MTADKTKRIVVDGIASSSSGAGLRGSVRPPGDKSISHRALILGAMACGEQRVFGLSEANDVSSTRRCLERLGCRVVDDSDGATRIGGPLAVPRDPLELDAGNSGTTARLVAGMAAGLEASCVIDGDASLRGRPMERVAAPLREMGAAVETTGGCLPMRISGGALRGIAHAPDVASAQVKSAILIAGLRGRGTTTVFESIPTRDHTERMLSAMGVAVRRECAGRNGRHTEAELEHATERFGVPGNTVSIEGGSTLDAIDAVVPGDISAAAFLLLAATLVPESEVRILGTGVNPTRTGFLDLLRAMGARIEAASATPLPNVVPRTRATGAAVEDWNEPTADLIVRSAPLRAVVLDSPELVASAIDELPALAVAATQADGETVVSGAAELRRKESDRIRAIVRGLSRMGARIEERPDGFAVWGPARLHGAEVSAHGDHRIAMSLAVAGLVAEGATTIDGAETVAISYPGFFRDIAALEDATRAGTTLQTSPLHNRPIGDAKDPT